MRHVEALPWTPYWGRGLRGGGFGFTNPPDGRKRHLQSVISFMCIESIRNMLSTYFVILPAIPLLEYLADNGV